MFDFTFHNPTRIIFGAGKESLIGAELNAAGIKNVLLVYGRNSVVKSGLLERVLTSLKASNIAWTQYGGVDSNPLLSHTREGVTLAKRGRSMPSWRWAAAHSAGRIQVYRGGGCKRCGCLGFLRRQRG
jgi:alcohol dehydrogenase YqhD (iron-dependent ADH family)